MQSFGLRDLTADPPRIENRLQHTRPKRPRPGRAFEQIRELGAFQAEQRGETDVGKVRSLGHADVGVGGDEILLGLTDVGSALQQRCRQTVGHRGEEQGVDVASPRNQAGIVTEQDADEVLLLRDLTLELGHPGQGLAVLRFSLLIVARGDGAFLETHPLQPRRFTQALRGALRDFELPVQRPQLDIAAGDRSDHRQDHRAFALLAGEKAGAGRLRCAPQLAPDVQLEARREIHPVVRESPPAGQYCIRTRAFPRRRSAGIELRKLRGAHDAVLSECLIHVGGRDLEILVVRERCSYKARQDRVLELVRPGDVGDLARLRATEAPCRGHIDFWAAVVRTDHAGRQGHCEQQPERAISHARCVPG